MGTAKVRMQVGKVWVEVDAMSVKEAFQALSDYAEPFRETTCGLCQGTDVVPNFRESKEGYAFYEMQCSSCGARLEFGQTKEGGRLFPRRKDKEGNPLGSNGWYQWQATQPDTGW